MIGGPTEKADTKLLLVENKSWQLGQ
jgi:hypothetical protein